MVGLRLRGGIVAPPRALSFCLLVVLAGGCSDAGLEDEVVGSDEASLASVLVARGARWRYLDNGTDPGASWKQPGFADGAWKEGPAQLGYGDGDEATTVSFGPNGSAKYVTTYFRRAFSVAEPASFGSLRVRLQRDDGAVVYLNGTEVFRSNMPGGTVGYRTYASSALGGNDETTFVTATVSAGLLRTNNVLAVEVHQANGTSSDLSFDLELLGEPAASSDPVLIAAGDIATCSSSYDTMTAELVKGIPGTVLTLGDNAYERGTTTEYRDCFGPTWGQFKSRIRPSPGNHEYYTSGATGSYGYFGSAAGDPARGYYSFDVGSWHVVSLNSNCSAIGGCGAGSAQERWLRQDLAASGARCTLAYWHHPRFSSGYHGNSSATEDLWDALYDAGADVVLVGHDHNYERYYPLTGSGTRDDARGLVEFVVGTGGKTLRSFTRSMPGTAVTRNADSYGVLKMTLKSDAMDFAFVGATGSYSDQGTVRCH